MAEGTAPLPPAYAPSSAHAHGHFQPLGDRWASLTPMRRVLLFAAVLVAVVVIANLLAAVRQPTSPGGDCPSQPCGPGSNPGGGNPGGVIVKPGPHSTATALLLDGQWKSALGSLVEWETRKWTESARKDRSIFLLGSKSEFSLFVVIAPATESTPEALAADRLAFLKTLAPDLADESDPKRQTLGIPMIGNRQATASLLAGNYTKDQDVEPWSVALVSAGDGRISVVIQLVAADAVRDSAFKAADQVLGEFLWPE